MTDRELLELAAKAAGIELRPMEMKNVSFQGDDKFIGYMCDGARGWFNPLTDDGDALRLAVTLNLSVSTGPCVSHANSIAGALRGAYMKEDCIQQDQNAATRRAIVRAAAEIGKDMTNA